MTNVVSLNEIADVFNGKTPAKAEQRRVGHPVLKIRDVDDHGRYRGMFESFIDPELAARFPAKWIREGDTLILNAAHNADYVASKTYFAEDAVTGALATGEWLVVRPKAEVVHPTFLNYWLRSQAAKDAIRFLVKGIHLYPKDVAGLKLGLPGPDEQQRIVDLLSRSEGIVHLRREAQKKTAEIIPALFLDMFGDPATNPKEWPVQPFGATGTVDRGRSRHRPRDAVQLYGGPYPFIQTGDVTASRGRITRYSATYSQEGLAQSKLWPTGTLCITIAANIAKTGVLSFDACFPDSVVGFLPGSDVTVEYVQAWLDFLQPTLEAAAPQAAQKNINLEILRKLPLALPPILKQREFARHCQSVISISLQQQEAITKAAEAFNALLTRLFSQGKPEPVEQKEDRVAVACLSSSAMTG